MAADEYRSAKEAFVSGLSGTSLWEISLITITLSAGYLLMSVAVVCLSVVQHLKLNSTLFSFLFDYAAVVLPGILLFTVLADYSWYLLVPTLLLSLAIVVYTTQPVPKVSLGDAFNSPYPRRVPFGTLARTYVNLFTAIAILAVDFPIFPRRLAKAETYGTGLMDVGVGAFLLANAGTAPEARYPERFSSNHSLKSYLKMLVLTGRYVLPLFVLGLVRLAAVKSTDYQEHVTEYGVHWNFFFTVAVVRLLCTAVHPLIHLLPRYPYACLALALATLHQSYLSLWGGNEYIKWGPNGDGSRPTLFSANREGIISCVGYLVIYTGGIEVGRWLMRQRSTVKEFLPVLLELVIADVVFWSLTTWCDSHIDRISRRFVNLPYILWIVRIHSETELAGYYQKIMLSWKKDPFSYGFMMMAIFLAIDCLVLPLSRTLHTSHPSPLYNTQHTASNICIISAVDYNQLFFFVVANLFTGFVNFSVDTLHASVTFSLAVLVVYMMVLVSVFVLLHRFRIKVKL